MSDKGYLVPDPIDPGEALCIRVYVPNDVKYIGAFWRAYSFFGEWIAWQKDDAHTGKDAAAVWKPLIEQARTEFNLGGGCGVVDVRQNSEDPCELDKTTDGETWEQWANLQLCPPLVRQSPDGSTWWWNPACNDGAGCWEPVPTPAGFDDTDEPPVPPPFPPGSPEYEDMTAQCIAAANMALGLKTLIRAIIDGFFAVEGASVWTFLGISVIAFILAPEIAIPLAAALIVLAAIILETSLDADFAAFDWNKLRDRIYCQLGRDGVMTEHGKAELITDNADWDYPAANQIGWILHDMLSIIPAAVLTYLGSIAQSEITPDCSDAECNAWTHHFDFLVEDGGFTPIAPGDAQWIEGVGWTFDAHETVYITRNDEPYSLHEFCATWEADLAFADYQGLVVSTHETGGDTDPLCQARNNALANTGGIQCCVADHIATTLTAQVNTIISPSNGAWVSADVSGTGHNPFI